MGLRSWISELVISTISSIVFFFLDILDDVLCIVFGIVDQLLEETPSSCYCSGKQELRDDIGISETLHMRKNFAREIMSGSRRRNCSSSARKEKNRWSDCGCRSCVSWMNGGNCSGSGTGTGLNLHVVVRNQETDGTSEKSLEEVENVIFIHGFLSSSSLWQETVFPNLSHHSKHNYNFYAVDLLGFGKSPKPSDCLYTLNDHVDLIESSIIDSFGLKSFHLVAHSMGCLIALALAARWSESVKSIYLVAPPYFCSSTRDASMEVLRKLSVRGIWPPLLFGSAIMSWYEHIGRCVCFFICRNHKTWEWILKLVLRKRELHFMITDMTRHTHHSAWHTMHNVICGGAKFTDGNLEILGNGVLKRIHVVIGMKDQVVPVECSFEMKKKIPEIQLQTIGDADHNSVIFGRELDFTRDLEKVWASAGSYEC